MACDCSGAPSNIGSAFPPNGNARYGGAKTGKSGAANNAAANGAGASSSSSSSLTSSASSASPASAAGGAANGGACLCNANGNAAGIGGFVAAATASGASPGGAQASVGGGAAAGGAAGAQDDAQTSGAETLLSSNARFQAISAIAVTQDGVINVADQGEFGISQWHLAVAAIYVGRVTRDLMEMHAAPPFHALYLSTQNALSRGE